ncbi:alpha/beta hydrolase [Streptomyces kasugaensis]|uniref:alpha/beta hydrolase n=1 Tax=Streptomyces kasugaensis TaxID=1946 RepID=UPI0013EF9A42|nr:alpha/beta hydrolase [Streptomyces kasugaensis]
MDVRQASKSHGFRRAAVAMAVCASATAAVLVPAVLTPAAEEAVPSAVSPPGRTASKPVRPARTPGAGLGPYYRQRIHWTPCAGTLNVQGTDTYRRRFECGTVTVPLDYGHPGSGEIRLAVNRMRTTGPGRRLGSLLLNFGGPGEPVVAVLPDMAGFFPGPAASYDLVGVDPRGTGGSSPVVCGPGVAMTVNIAEPPTQVAADQRAKNATCGTYSGKLLPWVGTPDAARDMDVVRAALGEQKLNYMGFSYGTTLGANYAHQFPTRVGRFVLDSVVDPTHDPEQEALAQTASEQAVLDDFLADCAARGADCPLGGTGQSAADELTALYQDAKAQGGAGEFVQAIRNGLYSEASWPAIRQALAQLEQGDTTGIARLAGGGGASGLPAAVAPHRSAPADGPGRYDDPGGADDPGRPGGSDRSGRSGPADRNRSGPARSDPDPDAVQAGVSMRAIACRDTSARYDADAFTRALPAFLKASPLFGEANATGLLSCAGWPVAGDDTSRQVRAAQAPPMLLVATTDDPATPYDGAAHMARALGNGSTVLTLRGSGHGAYVTPSACVHRNVDAFLLHGVLPAKGTTCS